MIKVNTQKKLNKAKLVKNVGTIVLTAGLLLSLSDLEIVTYSQPVEIQAQQETTLGEVGFVNQELYSIICQKLKVKSLSTLDLKRVVYLEIPRKLENSDLSDLNKLTSLRKLYVNDNELDCKWINNLEGLKKITVNKGSIINTDQIPYSVTELDLSLSVSKDECLVLPFYLERLFVIDSNISTPYFRNPEIVKVIRIKGQSYLDLDAIKDCVNLEYLTIEKCSNVKHCEALLSLSQIKNMNLDDYAPIWISEEVLDSLEVKDKERLLEETKALDNIAKSLVPANSNYSESEKKKILVNYVLDSLTTDRYLTMDCDAKNPLIKGYYNYPISYALRAKDASCVTYTSLLQALCNRVGIDAYECFNDTYTWSALKENETYRYVDLQALDNEEIEPSQRIYNALYSISIPNSNYIPTIDYKEIDLHSVAIEENGVKKIKVVFNGKDFILKASSYLILLFLLNIIYAGHKALTKKQDKENIRVETEPKYKTKTEQEPEPEQVRKSETESKRVSEKEQSSSNEYVQKLTLRRPKVKKYEVKNDRNRLHEKDL